MLPASTGRRSLGQGRKGFNVQTQSSNQGLAQARMMHKVSIAAAVAFFALLVVAFGLKWAAYYQVAAGLAAYLCVEWQRRLDRKVKELAKPDSSQGVTRAA